ncbi:serine recombinase [Rhodococcus sp. NPDC055024]
MTEAVDRMWNIRDAVLLWMYTEKANGRGENMTVEASDVESAADWRAEPITTDEIRDATTYLFEKRLVNGQHRSNGQLSRAQITAEGEDWAERGTTIRPGRTEPANTSGVVYNNTFNNHGPSNNAVNSSDFTQTITVDQKTEKILEVADALEAHAESGPANADEARRIAAGLRGAAPEPEVNKLKLQALLASAIGAFTLAFGTTVGQQATQLAVSAIQSLG